MVVVDPSDSSFIPVDWSDVVGESALDTVDHAAPTGLTRVSQAHDTGTASSAFRMTGWAHGRTYHIECTATLTNGEIYARVVPVLALNGI
jgi:hypothetical protein